MRTSILLALLLAAAPLGAQRVTGVAVDSSTDVPLRCVDVTLQDTTGRVLARTLTAADGSFGLEAASPGPHELRFTGRNGQPVCALEYGTPFNFNAHP